MPDINNVRKPSAKQWAQLVAAMHNDKRAAYRINRHAAANEEERQRRVVANKEAKALLDAARAARDARREALLRADVEYQSLKARCDEQQRALDALPKYYHKPIEVGVVTTGVLPMFHVRVEAYTWAEALAKLAEKTRKEEA